MPGFLPNGHAAQGGPTGGTHHDEVGQGVPAGAGGPPSFLETITHPPC